MEDQNTEYKEQWDDDNLKTICAFANSSGGRMLLGVDDKGVAIGLKNVKTIMEVVPNKIRNILGIVPNLTVEKRNGKDIVVVEIERSSSPIAYNCRYYSRSGSNTFELKGGSLSRFLITKSGKSWDEYIEENATIDDIDLETLKNYKAMAKKRLPMIGSVEDPKEILERLHLMEDGKLKKAAVLLFGKEPRKFFLQALLKIGRFTPDNHILGSDEIEGNLFQQIDKAMEVLRTKYLKVEFRTGGIHRQEIWEYPYDALKEAITNALVHRDYLGTAPTQMKIFDDQLWLWNIGGLPEGIRIEELSKKHNSTPRNNLLAEIMFKASVIEAWGVGTVNMIELCKQQEMPAPEFKEEQGGFSVWFFKDSFNEEALRTLGFNERQMKAVLYVKEKGLITNKEYCELSKISKAMATIDLNDLISKGVFIRHGTTGKSIRYLLRNK